MFPGSTCFHRCGAFHKYRERLNIFGLWNNSSINAKDTYNNVKWTLVTVIDLLKGLSCNTKSVRVCNDEGGIEVPVFSYKPWYKNTNETDKDNWKERANVHSHFWLIILYLIPLLLYCYDKINIFCNPTLSLKIVNNKETTDALWHIQMLKLQTAGWKAKKHTYILPCCCFLLPQSEKGRGTKSGVAAALPVAATSIAAEKSGAAAGTRRAVTAAAPRGTTRSTGELHLVGFHLKVAPTQPFRKHLGLLMHLLFCGKYRK